MSEFLLICLLTLSAFFSASETAFFAFRGSSSIQFGGLTGKLLENPIRFLSFILLGNNLVNIAFSALGTLVILTNWGEGALTLGTIVLTGIVIILAEILPKTLAASSYKKVVPLFTPSLYFLSRLLMPVSSLFYFFAEKTLKTLFGERVEKQAPLAQEELELLMEEAVHEGLFLPEERRIVQGIAQLEGKTAREIMQPRPKVVALPAEADALQAVEVFQKSGVSRLPLFRSTLDKIVGVLHAKDLLQALLLEKGGSLQKIMRHPLFVPEGITLNRLLGEFKRRQTHIAIVVDEYGGTSGIVTLEDILEEIVGEIWDEYDQVRMRGIKTASNTYLCSAEMEREELEKLGIIIPEDHKTLSSFLIELTGRIPQAGEKVIYEGWEFTVLTSKPNKIETVRISRCAS